MTTRTSYVPRGGRENIRLGNEWLQPTWSQEEAVAWSKTVTARQKCQEWGVDCLARSATERVSFKAEICVTPALLKLKKETIDGMVRFMKFGGADNEHDPEYDPTYDAGYTQTHIDQCAIIIDRYFAALGNASDTRKSERILSTVRTAVLALNALNEKCDGSLISTDQREVICKLITSAAKHSGLKSDKDDITEEWRDW